MAKSSELIKAGRLRHEQRQQQSPSSLARSQQKPKMNSVYRRPALKRSAYRQL
jgi:hypothetical protein